MAAGGLIYLWQGGVVAPPSGIPHGRPPRSQGRGRRAFRAQMLPDVEVEKPSTPPTVEKRTKRKQKKAKPAEVFPIPLSFTDIPSVIPNAGALLDSIQPVASHIPEDFLAALAPIAADIEAERALKKHEAKIKVLKNDEEALLLFLLDEE